MKRLGLAKKTPELINFTDERSVVEKDFEQKPLLLITHGFGSHCENLKILAQRFDDWGYTVIAFNYRSYAKIADIAKSLADLLKILCPPEIISSGPPIDAIGHSMGGLVLRSFILKEGGQQFIRRLAMLGTPNNATLKSSKIVKHMLRHVKHVSHVLDPSIASIARGMAAKELTKSDSSTGNMPFIDVLNGLQCLQQDSTPLLSIAAGGGPTEGLRVSKRRLVNALINKELQRILGDPRNDGLVIEKSVNLKAFLDCVDGTCEHCNDDHYADYYHLDHSGLVESQIVAGLVNQFFKSNDPPVR